MPSLGSITGFVQRARLRFQRMGGGLIFQKRSGLCKNVIVAYVSINRSHEKCEMMTDESVDITSH